MVRILLPLSQIIELVLNCNYIRLRISDGHSMMNFLCRKSINKHILNLKTGDIVKFDETSWIPYRIDDEYVILYQIPHMFVDYFHRLTFKIMTKDFEVLTHKRLQTPKKFWGAGPVPKGMHRQIDQSLSDVSSDDDNQLDEEDGDSDQSKSIEQSQTRLGKRQSTL